MAETTGALTGFSGDASSSRETPSGPRHAPRKPGSERSPRRRGRGLRSVRARVVAIVTVPVVSLLALSTYGAVTTIQDVAAQRAAREVNADVLVPLRQYIEAVQAERTAVSSHLAAEAPAVEDVTSAAERTEAAITALDDGIAAARTAAAELDQGIPAAIDATLESARALESLRESAVARNVSWDEAYRRYTDVVESAFRARAGLSTVPVAEDAPDQRVVYELVYGREMLARVDAVMAAAGANETMTTEQYAEVVGAASTSEALLAPLTELRGTEMAAYRSVAESESYARLGSLVEAIVAAGPDNAVVAGQNWDSAADVVLADLADAEAVSTALADGGVLTPGAFGTLGPVVAMGLAGALLSLLIYVLAGRLLFRDLVRLRYAALDLATNKLPDTLRRLNDGAEVDLDTEAPPTQQSSDEIGQINAALNAVHRAAISMAIERAHVVRSLSGVYVSLARRSQVLLHRQLALLDDMERRTENPQDLEDLFRLDHLTIRMRRQAESLIILSGASPARRWRYPVPVIDVVRGAVAEVEDFARVDVREMPDISVVGASVADLTHMIAELVDNALAFSPPHTRPVVRGFLAGSSLAIEIEDQGLGMSRQAMADANERIQDAGKVDLTAADQLGLLVVNRLAHRQNARVALRRSPRGGVAATVLIPDGVLEARVVAARRFVPDLQHASGADDGRARGVRSRPREFIAPDPSTVPAGDARPASADTWTEDPVSPATPRSHDTGGAQFSQQVVAAANEPLGTADELPRRVRQANLAPELRAEAHQGKVTAPARPSRTPEQARATLVALRSGWLRGLNEIDDHQGKSG